MRSVRLRITGRVQGVGYRAWAIGTARRLSVEALVTGGSDAVAAMIEACRDGPLAARVAEVAVSDDEDDGSPGFVSRPTV